MRQLLIQLLVVVAVSLSAVEAATAQHDPHRNAVRLIAAGKFDEAAIELNKADADDTETDFVQMLIQLEQGNLESATQHANRAIENGLPIERFIAGPRKQLAPLYKSTWWQDTIEQQPHFSLVHGPMLGSVTDAAASFWVRTSSAAKVSIRVIDPESDKLLHGTSTTSAETDYTTIVRVTGLDSAKSYSYQLTIDEKSIRVANNHFTTFPEQGKPAKFKIAFGGGAGFVPKWEYMFDTIVNSKPVAMLMLGDNVYIDDPEHELTNKYCYYRRQSRPEWRRFIARTSMFSIYDDHDFGMNDCIPGPEIENPTWKRQVWNLFRQNWINPAYGGGEAQPGCWYDFYIGDVHFIMLDGRYYRTRKPEPSMLGPVQKKWLLQTLEESQGTFKVLASPVPWTENIKPGSNDPWDGFTDEREEIFSFIESRKIDGVLLMAADRHRTDLRVTKRENGYDFYEFESSKLTNRHTHAVVKTPGLIWGYNEKCSFGLIEFDTVASPPTLTMKAINIDGEQIHSHELKLKDLQH